MNHNINTRHLNKNDRNEIILNSFQMIEDVIIEDPLVMASPNCNELIVYQVSYIFEIQLENLLGNSIETGDKELINASVERALELYYILYSPKRSYGDSFIRKPPNKTKIRHKLEYLCNVPQPDQRTDAWYIFRHKYLTASSIWKAFSSEGVRNSLIYDKCKPLDTNKYKGFCVDSPMHWGHKYEPLSIEWYEYIYNTKVSDFGCIPHKNVEYIAASPDGINTCDKSDRYGRMVEVKNIVNRDITGIPKLEYWIQMQFQMEVCELNECDFLETRFKEYDSKEDFDKDGNSFQKTQNGNHKGIFIYYVKDGEAHYEYPPFMCTEEEFVEWEEKTMQANEDKTWIQNIYWRLDEVSCVLVLRNKIWYKSTTPALDNIWATICREKNGDYTHRAPKKRLNSKKEIPSELPGKCCISIKTPVLHENI